MNQSVIAVFIDMMNARPILVFDKTNKRVVTEDNKINIFHTDKFIKNSDYECSDEVVEKVVEMFNKKNTLYCIDDYLLDEGECTTESKEVIMEGLHLFLFNITE